MVTAQAIQVRRKGRTLIGHFDLAFDTAGITAIVGRNGSGKSTFLRTLHGLEKLQSGSIAFENEALADGQAFVFQTPAFLRRSVRQNLDLPFQVKGQTPQYDQIADDMQITPFLDMPAHQLSTGEQQRVSLTRALMMNPKLLLLDEPTASLDGTSTHLIETAIQDAVEHGVAVILASHSMGQVRRLSDRVIYFEHGVAHGPFDTSAFFAQTPQVAKDWMEEGR